MPYYPTIPTVDIYMVPTVSLVLCTGILLQLYPSALLQLRVHPRPFILLGHFFAVAFYAIFAALTSAGVLRLPKGMYNGAAILFKACKIIVPLVWSEVRTLMVT